MTDSDFFEQSRLHVAAMSKDDRFKDLSETWLSNASAHKYSHNFTWLGRPIIQLPQDIVAVQELIWSVRPDLIIETGVARGGSLVLSASVLALLDLFESRQRTPSMLEVSAPKRRVVGVDVDLRQHNRDAIVGHPLADWIQLFDGSSTDPGVFQQIQKVRSRFQKCMVFLDSNHTHDHVLAELKLYSELISVGSYCVVFDTAIESFPPSAFPDRPWGPGNSPHTAVQDFLQANSSFEIDSEISSRLAISVAPDGYLKRIS